MSTGQLAAFAVAVGTYCLASVLAGFWLALMAIIEAVMFVGNMGTHGQYPLDPAVQFARERLAA